ncbi:MAG: AMP-binding protein, partial [Rhodoferax sp.]
MNDISQQDFGLIADLIREHAAQAPARRALIEGERTLAYGTLDALMDRTAAALQRAGVRVGEAIAICASPSIEYAVVFLGALRAGVAVAPLAPSSTPDSLLRMAADAQARLFFLDAGVAAALGAASDAAGDSAGTTASMPRIALDGAAFAPALYEWLAPEGARPTRADIHPETPFNIIYSSGTTGEPKGIVQGHGMRWAHVQRGDQFSYGPDTVTVLATPLYSNTTLVMFFPTLAFGGTVVLMPKFDALGYLALAQAQRATHTMLV